MLKMSEPKKFKQVVAGEEHALALTDDGKVYS